MGRQIDGRKKCGTGILACAILILLAAGLVAAQPRPRINFDRLLSIFPDLPWDFEIRYVETNGANTDMLRVHYDGQADLVRWRPDYAGSLASVCHSRLEQRDFKKLLELLRDKKFNDLPSDPESLVTVALHSEITTSVRLGRTIVRKIDRGQLDNAPITQIEDQLRDLANFVAADWKAKCNMESVPAQP
jgi:hypothetical protein